MNHEYFVITVAQKHYFIFFIVHCYNTENTVNFNVNRVLK